MTWTPVRSRGEAEDSPVYAYTDGEVNIVKHREDGVEKYMIAVLPGAEERMTQKHPPVRSWHGPFETSKAAIAFYRKKKVDILAATSNLLGSRITNHEQSR